MQTVVSALDNFVAAYLDQAQSQEVPMMLEYDSDWQSPCYQAQGSDGDWVPWKPVRREGTQSFEGLESALGITIDPQLKAYFSAYWSDNLNASNERGELQLLLPWNEDDFDRLQQNLVGHVLMKRRLKQPETLFFGVTDEEDFIITLDNQSGQVMLEQVGLEPKEALANNLADFLASLTPAPK